MTTQVCLLKIIKYKNPVGVLVALLLPSPLFNISSVFLSPSPEPCDAKVNNACPAPTNCADYCPACDLYVKHSWVDALKGSNPYTETRDRGGHRLVSMVSLYD